MSKTCEPDGSSFCLYSPFREGQLGAPGFFLQTPKGTQYCKTLSCQVNVRGRGKKKKSMSKRQVTWPNTTKEAQTGLQRKNRNTRYMLTRYKNIKTRYNEDLRNLKVKNVRKRKQHLQWNNDCHVKTKRPAKQTPNRMSGQHNKTHTTTIIKTKKRSNEIDKQENVERKKISLYAPSHVAGAEQNKSMTCSIKVELETSTLCY